MTALIVIMGLVAAVCQSGLLIVGPAYFYEETH